VVNADSLRAMYTGFQTLYNQAFQGVQPLWDRVAMLVPIRDINVQYSWLSEFPELREWVGDRQIKSLSAFSYTVTNKAYEATIGVPREHVEFDRYGLFGPRFSMMGYAAANHPNRLVFDLLAAGFTNTCYDGQFFFDNDHPVGSGIVSNVSTGAAAPWYLVDASKPIMPLVFQRARDYDFTAMDDPQDENVFMRREYVYGVDAFVAAGYGLWQLAWGSKATLDATAFATAYDGMMAFKSDEGRPLGVKATHLIVGPGQANAARKLLMQEYVANGESNIHWKRVELIECPWLT
jgi:phage major head subunit gpT-like protein